MDVPRPCRGDPAVHACSVDGSDPFLDPIPAGVDDSGINGILTGQDSLTVTVSGAGAQCRSGDGAPVEALFLVVVGLLGLRRRPARA